MPVNKEVDEEVDEVENSAVPVIHRKKVDTPKVHLFSIATDNGPDIKFMGYSKISFATTLKALEIYAERGEAAMEAFAIKEVLGQDGFDRLMSLRHELDDDEFQDVLKYVNKTVMGPGGSGKARAKGRTARRG